MSETRQLLEYVSQTGPFEVDVENAIIKGIRILGLESANGRSYLREGVTKGLPLYEGKATNVDHPAKPGEPTGVARRNGWLEKVAQHADGGLNGEWHLLKSHPLTPMILEVAQRNPKLLGLSHNASGKTRREGGREIVESIDAVHSVDVVADPASVSGFKEGLTMKRKVKDLIECLCKTRPGYARGLKEEAEAGVLSPEMEMEEPPMPPAEAPPTEPADHEAALKAGFRAAIIACLDDDALDMKAKVKKIGEILKMEEKMLGNGNGETPKDEPSESKAAEESRKALAGALLELKAFKLLSTKGIKATPLIERALKGCTTEKEVTELIESLPISATGGAKSSDGSGKTQADKDKALQEQKVPEDHKTLVKWLHE